MTATRTKLTATDGAVITVTEGNTGCVVDCTVCHVVAEEDTAGRAKLTAEYHYGWHNAQNLTSRQKRLLDDVTAHPTHGDYREALIATDADARDKAAVAEALGGVGAGDEFRRAHVSKRSECVHCPNDIEYLDGIRNPYWVHTDRVGRGHNPLKAIEPNDARTRLVFEKTKR